MVHPRLEQKKKKKKTPSATLDITLTFLPGWESLTGRWLMADVVKVGN
jgi:hypothetical protein